MNEGFTEIRWTKALEEIGAILRLDDSQAERTLEEACRREPPRCGRCGGRRLYRLHGGRMRCAECRYSFRRFTGRWLGRHRLPAKTWLAAIKCFEVGLGARELAQVAGLSLPTALDIERTVQMSLGALDPSWNWVVQACATGAEVPRAFRVRRQGDGMRVEPLAGELADIVIDLPQSAAAPDWLRALRAGARRWLRLPPDRLALKLKELEFRWAPGGLSLELLVGALARYMPTGIPDREPPPGERAEIMPAIAGTRSILRASRGVGQGP